MAGRLNLNLGEIIRSGSLLRWESPAQPGASGGYPIHSNRMILRPRVIKKLGAKRPAERSEALALERNDRAKRGRPRASAFFGNAPTLLNTQTPTYIETLHRRNSKRAFLSMAYSNQGDTSSGWFCITLLRILYHPVFVTY